MEQGIIGIGTDIIELVRVKKIIERGREERFIKRVLTDAERLIYLARGARKVEYLGGRFAAKEALAKALGTGIGEAVSFLDIEILPDEHGKPCCTLSEHAQQKLQLPPQYRLHVSLSHSDHYASAFAIVESISAI